MGRLAGVVGMETGNADRHPSFSTKLGGPLARSLVHFET